MKDLDRFPTRLLQRASERERRTDSRIVFG